MFYYWALRTGPIIPETENYCFMADCSDSVKLINHCLFAELKWALFGKIPPVCLHQANRFAFQLIVL
jgi:hypothetical protein